MTKLYIEFSEKLNVPYDNDELALRNIKEWLTIVEIFNSSDIFKNHCLVSHVSEQINTETVTFNIFPTFIHSYTKHVEKYNVTARGNWDVSRALDVRRVRAPLYGTCPWHVC